MATLIIEVDDEDADLLQYVTDIRVTLPNRVHTTLHAAIADRMGMEREVVDHANRKPVDNRRKNLRPATRRQNAANKRMRSDNTTGYIGVHRHRSRFLAKQGGQHLGMFDTPEDAARAYDEHVTAKYGEFAVTNFEA